MVNTNGTQQSLVAGQGNACDTLFSKTFVILRNFDSPRLVIGQPSGFMVLIAVQNPAGNSYRWYFNGAFYRTTTDPWIDVDYRFMFGTYSVQSVNIGGCTSVMSPTVVLSSLASNFVSNSIQLIPNPASRSVFLESDEPIFKVKILSSLGVLVAEYQEKQELNIGSLPKWVYQVFVETSRGIGVKRLVKE
jgi:hypothetical protein